MGFKLRGFDEFRDSFKRLRERGPETIDASVRRHMQDDLFPETQRLVPKASGRLQETGHVEPAGKQGAYRVVYGDSSTNNDSMVDYAAAVHQITKAKHAPPTGPKFVEEPLKEGVERLAQRVADDLEKLARG